MRIELNQDGYRIVPDRATLQARAREAAAAAAPQCDSCATDASAKPARQADVAELHAIPFETASAAVAARPASPVQRIKLDLVAGTVNRPIDLFDPQPRNAILDRAYFLNRRDLAAVNAAATERTIDVTG